MIGATLEVLTPNALAVAFLPNVPDAEFSSNEIAKRSKKGKTVTKGNCSVPGTNFDLW